MAHTSLPVANHRAFLASLFLTLIGGAGLLIYFGLATVPVNRSPQEAAGYFGIRLIPLGLVLMIVGFAQTLAIAVANALPEPVGPAQPRATLGLSTLAELLRAVGGLSSTPAGIGALVALLGTFLLVGSGAGARTIP